MTRGATTAGRRRLTLLAGLALAVHLVALYWPGSAEAGLDIPGADKVAHVLLFGVPVWLVGRLTGRIWLVAGIFALHAVVSELIQYWFLPHRSGDPLDLLADLLGIAAAVWLLVRRRSGVVRGSERPHRHAPRPGRGGARR